MLACMSLHDSVCVLVFVWRGGCVLNFQFFFPIFFWKLVFWRRCFPARLRVSLASSMRLTMTIRSCLTPTTLNYRWSHSLTNEYSKWNPGNGKVLNWSSRWSLFFLRGKKRAWEGERSVVEWRCDTLHHETTTQKRTWSRTKPSVSHLQSGEY
jgi:hypothetical protein